MLDRKQAAAIALPIAAAWALHLSLAISSLSQKSATYDEPVYVVAGVSYLTLGDFSIKSDAPPLVAILAGLAAGEQGLEIPAGRLGFSDRVKFEYPFSIQTLYRSGNDADAILFWSRIAVLLPFSLLLLASVQRFASGLFGSQAGLVALFITALSPNLLAHARWVAADYACAATMLFASFAAFRWTRRPTAGAALLAGLALGLALVTKFTSLLLLPSLGVAAGIAAWRGRMPLHRLASHSGVAAAAAAVIVSAIYGWPPEPQRYIEGLGSIYTNLRSDYPWYLFGSFYPPGLPGYYVAVLAVKTSLPLLGLGLGSLALLRRPHVGLPAELCLFLPAATLLIVSAADEFSGGVRRVLPVLPVLAVASSRWVPAISAIARPRLRIAAFAGLGALLIWHAGTSLSSWPHFLPYFNELAGGQANGPNLLDDANLDWGQDLAALPAVLSRHGIEQVRLLYWGTADPAYYGIDALPVTPASLRSPRPGVYAVSQQYLIRMRLQRSAWLLDAQPFDRAGTSILLFRAPDPPGATRSIRGQSHSR